MGKRSVIGGEKISKEEPKDRNIVRDVRIGVFFEGSGLNMANEVFYNTTSLKLFRGKKRVLPDNVNSVEDITPGMLCGIEQEEGRSEGFTNVSMMFTLFNGEQFEEVPYKKIYIEGAGTTDDSDVKYSVGGFASGDGKTGVTALVSKAVRNVTEYVCSLSDANSKETCLHFYIFGFSRGATCSRLFCHLLTRDKGSTLRCEEQFSKYGARNLVKGGRLEFLEEYKCNSKITVDFLGLYDTVASIGFLKRKDGSTAVDALGVAGGLLAGGLGGALVGGASGALIGGSFGALAGGVAAEVLPEWHYDNVEKYGLYIDRKVKSVCHLCAMDEFRENFALVNLGKSVPGNAVEIMIPGCHSDVGGSYLDGTKTSSVSKGGIAHKKRKISFSPYNVAPTDTGYVSLSSFQELGWIGPKENKASESTENHSEVELVRKIDRGYSDIPLAMMVKYCHGETGIKLFNSVPVFHDYSKCGDTVLANFGKEMVAKMGQVRKQGRYWLFPTNYERLRLKHLHFSASDALLPVNAPSYNEDDVMCRITYYGDERGPKSAAEGVHFLYELSGTPMNIEFGEDSSAIRYLCQKELSSHSMSKAPKVRI